MLRSALELDDGAILECDICIVGAGAAGLSVAHEFAGTGLRVIVVAGGGRKQTRRTQALYRGEVVNAQQHGWAHKFRVRRYGGTTGIWGGRCLPLDPIDFEQRAYVPDSGWPFGRETLDPYYLRAANYCEIGAPLFDAAQALPDQAAALVSGSTERDIISSTLERFSRPTDFGRLLERHLEASPSVTVLLDAHCAGLRGNEAGDRVERVECVTFRPSRFSIAAAHVVLAAGGIETTRLLLAAKAAPERPLAIASPWLGSGYMCHLIGSAGVARFNVPPETIQYGYHRSADGIYCRRRFWVSPEAQRRLGILNVIFRLEHAPINDPAHGNPVLSAMYLVKDLILYEYSRKMRQGRNWRHSAGHLRNVLAHPVTLSRFAGYWLRNRNLAARQIPSVVLFSDSGTYQVEFQSEQAPDAASRINLSPDRDAFGMPTVSIDWRCNALDVASVHRSYALLKQALERDGLGTVDYDTDMIDAKISEEGALGGHHLGTTRIGRSAADGVVDADMRLFGVANCYVASGSALPTSGTANPTYTITALAIRLSDHLKTAMAVRARKSTLSTQEIAA